MILAGSSRAFPYADPSKPAPTAPGARGADCPVAGCAGACAQTTAQAKAQIIANASTGFISDPFYDFIIRPSPSFMYELIMEGAPLLAAPPVHEMTSPTLTVFRVQP